MSPEMRLAKQRHAKLMEENRQRGEKMRSEHAKQMEELKQKWEEDRQARTEQFEQRMEESRQARAKQMEEIEKARAKLEQKWAEDRQARAQWMEEHEQNEAKIAQQKNSFREGFGFDGIFALVKILRIIFQVLLLPMTIGLFIVKASLFPRNSVFNKLFDFLDLFSLFGE